MADKKTNLTGGIIGLLMLLLCGVVVVFGPRQIKVRQTKNKIAKIPNKIKSAVNDSLATNPEYLNLVLGSKYECEHLVKQNQKLFDSAVLIYRARLEREYNMGRFFTDAEIREINSAMHEYADSEIQRIVKNKRTNIGEIEFWNFVRKRTLDKNSSIMDMIATFNKMAFIPLTGIKRDGGKIGFTNQANNKLIQKFYDEYFIDSPNFKVAEFASIKKEYVANLKTIQNFDNDMMRISELEQNVRDFYTNQFAAYQDSLVHKLSELCR